MSLSFPVAPMKAALGTLPTDDERWAYEIKWDGYRTLAFVDDGEVRLQSSNLYDVTAKYPELCELHNGVHARRAILDGELVVPLGRQRGDLDAVVDAVEAEGEVRSGRRADRWLERAEIGKDRATGEGLVEGPHGLLTQWRPGHIEDLQSRVSHQ